MYFRFISVLIVGIGLGWSIALFSHGSPKHAIQGTIYLTDGGVLANAKTNCVVMGSGDEILIQNVEFQGMDALKAGLR